MREKGEREKREKKRKLHTHTYAHTLFCSSRQSVSNSVRREEMLPMTVANIDRPTRSRERTSTTYEEERV